MQRRAGFVLSRQDRPALARRLDKPADAFTLTAS
jgi:hypothetical protein